jgi:Fe-S oxidoreductase
MAGSGAPARDTDWLSEDLKVAEEGETAFFVGCLPLFNVIFQQELGVEIMEIARSAIRVLNRLGIEPVLIPDERCCGHDLLWEGDRESFTALARANAKAFSERGIRHIVTTCAECCRTLRLDYPEAVPDYQPRVEHLIEFLADRMDRKKTASSEDGVTTVTYQDPCRLGRHLGVYDAPREVLAALHGITLVEMDRTAQDAVCCGTAGFIHCDAASRRLQADRLRKAADTGADVLLTACPKCLIHFNCALAEDRRAERGATSLEVQDLAVFAATMFQQGRGAASSH